MSRPQRATPVRLVAEALRNPANDRWELAEALLNNDIVTARGLHHRLTPLFRNCFVESNPIPAKAALAAMGLINNELRLPLVPASEKTCALMQETVKGLGLL